MYRKLLILLIVGMMLAPSLLIAGGTTESAETELAEVHYMTWAGGGQREADERAVAKFNEENENINVTVEFVPEDYLSKLNTLVAADAAPDVFFLNEYLVHDWGAKGTIADLTTLFRVEGDKLAANEFVPGALFESDGKIWGATPGVEVILLYFNKDLFDEAGLSYPSQDPDNPWSWDEFVDAARQLTVDTKGRHPGQAGFDPKSISTFGTMTPTFWLFYMPFLYSNNARIASEDGMELAIDDPAATEALQALADLMHVHQAAPPPQISMGLPSTRQMLANGQLAMFISGQWELSGFGEEEYYEVGIAPLPMFKRPANISWGASVVINEKSANKDAAWKFMKSYIDPMAGIQLSIDGSWMPNQQAWFKDAEKLKVWTDNKRHNADFMKVVPRTATVIAEVPENVTLKNFGPMVDNYIGPALDELWLGEKSAVDAVKGLEDKVKDLLVGAWQ